MRDYMELGSAPADEECVQVAEGVDYSGPMRAECKRYVALLDQVMPEPPGCCYFGVKSFDHDFGRYYEVVIWFDEDDDDEAAYACAVENHLPMLWSDTRKREFTTFRVDMEARP